jgi:hypothetical protein
LSSLQAPLFVIFPRFFSVFDHVFAQDIAIY